MALVSHSPPHSASLYPASSGICSHSPAAEVRAPLVAAPKVGTPSGTRPASSASREGGNHQSKRDDVTGGKAAVDGLAAATAALELTEGLERQPASANPAGRSATLQQPARGYSVHSERSPSKVDATARAGSAVPSPRTGPLPGFQSRSASTPTTSSPYSSVPSSSSFRSTSPSSVQHAGSIYPTSASSAAASSSTSFVTAPTPAPTTPLHFSAAGASPAVTTSPQSYFAVATSDQQQRFANGPTQFSGQIPYPPHSPGYPNPAFPFLPSPHPSVPHMTAFGGTQMGMPSPQISQDQHALFLQYQQQWQMEMLKNQQQQANAHLNESAFQDLALPRRVRVRSVQADYRGSPPQTVLAGARLPVRPHSSRRYSTRSRRRIHRLRLRRCKSRSFMPACRLPPFRPSLPEPCSRSTRLTATRRRRPVRRAAVAARAAPNRALPAAAVHQAEPLERLTTRTGATSIADTETVRRVLRAMVAVRNTRTVPLPRLAAVVLGAEVTLASTVARHRKFRRRHKRCRRPRRRPPRARLRPRRLHPWAVARRLLLLARQVFPLRQQIRLPFPAHEQAARLRQFRAQVRAPDRVSVSDMTRANPVARRRPFNCAREPRRCLLFRTARVRTMAPSRTRRPKRLRRSTQA